MDDSTPAEYAQEHNDAQELPCLPNDTIAYILTFLPVGEQLSFQTLINCRLVSRNFSLTSKQDQVWLPWTRRYWQTPFMLGGAHLSENYSQPPEQETIESIHSHDGTVPPECDVFRIRTRFDAFARDQFDKLVSNSNGRLNHFTILLQLDVPVLDAIARSLADATADPAERLTRELWALEVERGLMRFETAQVWRQLDYGLPHCGHGSYTHRFEELALLGCSAFANQDVEDKVKLLVWIDILARDASIFLAPLATIIAEHHQEEGRQNMAFGSIILIFKKLHHLLFCYGLHPAPANAAPPLDLSFPNLVQAHTEDRNTAVDFSLFMKMETLGSATNEETPLGILKPMLRNRNPSISWTLYSAMFCAVASRLQLGLAVKCAPLSINKTIVRVQSWEGPTPLKKEEGILLFDLGDEEAQLAQGKKAERLPPGMTGCAILHQVAGDITAALASPKTGERPKLPLEEALYAALLIPSIVSRPYHGPEAVLRLTGAATKLASHLTRYFPFDLIILEDIVLPLVGTDPAKMVIKEAIEKVKKEDEGFEPRRRKEGEEPKFRLGDVVKSSERWVGVVSGYGSFDEEMYKSIERASTELPDRSDQLFYWILSADLPTPHFSYTHYAPEDSLSSTDRATQKDEIVKLLRVPGLGRWFGSVQSVAEGGKFRFVLSKEAAARFPDDVNGEGKLVDLEEFSSVLEVE